MYGTSGNYYYDEQDAKRDEYLKRQANVMGNKLMLMFKLTIFGIVMSLASIVLMLTIGVYAILYSGSSEQIIMYIAYGVVIVAFIIQAIYGGVLISMKEYDGRYMTSGLLYIFAQACTVVKEFLSETSLSWVAGFASLASSILGLISLLLFVNAIKDDIAPFNSYLSGSWEGFKKVYIGMIVITVIGVVVAFLIPGLGTLILAISGLLALILSIWQIVLLYKSGKAMLAFKEGF